MLNREFVYFMRNDVFEYIDIVMNQKADFLRFELQ